MHKQTIYQDVELPADLSVSNELQIAAGTCQKMEKVSFSYQSLSV